MKKHFVLILLITWFTNSVSAQNADSVIMSKNEIKTFLTDYYDQSAFFKKLRFINNSGKPLKIESVAKINDEFKLFSEEDFIFFEAQIRNHKEVIWDSSYIGKANFLDKKVFEKVFSAATLDSLKDPWDIFHKNYGMGYVDISYPLFSKDKNYCIIYQETSVGGLGGDGSIVIYKRQGKKWKLYKEKNLWSS